MVVGTVIQQIFRIGGVAAKQIARYNRYEQKLFKSAYRGFPPGFGRGARHGYVAGSIAGSLINPQNGVQNDALPPENFPSRTSQKYQARSRNKYSSRRKYKYCPPKPPYRRR